jgi:hypothetical protein
MKKGRRVFAAFLGVEETVAFRCSARLYVVAMHGCGPVALRQSRTACRLEHCNDLRKADNIANGLCKRSMWTSLGHVVQVKRMIVKKVDSKS